MAYLMVNTSGPEAFRAYIRSASQRYKIDSALIEAVIQVESGFDPNAVSRTGAMGLMQLMLKTAQHYQVTNRFSARLVPGKTSTVALPIYVTLWIGMKANYLWYWQLTMPAPPPWPDIKEFHPFLRPSAILAKCLKPMLRYVTTVPVKFLPSPTGNSRNLSPLASL
jgi:hypothetical protein